TKSCPCRQDSAMTRVLAPPEMVEVAGYLPGATFLFFLLSAPAQLLGFRGPGLVEILPPVCPPASRPRIARHPRVLAITVSAGFFMPAGARRRLQQPEGRIGVAVVHPLR